MKVVINRCYGGFSLSDEAVELILAQAPDLLYNEGEKLPKNGPWILRVDLDDEVRKGFPWVSSYYCNFEDHRSHPALVKAVEVLGEGANGWCANLKVVDVYGIFFIVEHNGFEEIVGVHTCEHCGQPLTESCECNHCGAPLSVRNVLYSDV